MSKQIEKINYKNDFQKRFRYLCHAYYKGKYHKSGSEKKVFDDIEKYCYERNLEPFKYITYKKWLSGEALPTANFVCILCEFFDCDTDYLFGTNHSFDEYKFEDFKDADPNLSYSKLDIYLKETYGLERKTLDFLRTYKMCGIDSISNADSPHNAEQPEHSFSCLLNLLIQNSPWLIANLLQILHAGEIGLCDRGTLDTIDDPIYDQYKRTNDLDVSLALLSMRIKELLKDPAYMPNSKNPLETYDPKVVNTEAINTYLTDTVKTRLTRLNDELNSLCNSDSVNINPPI